MSLKLKTRNSTDRKFSMEQIEEIKAGYKNCESQASLAERFGANQTTISRIVRGHTYKGKPSDNFECKNELVKHAEQIRMLKSKHTVLERTVGTHAKQILILQGEVRELREMNTMLKNIITAEK